MFRIARLRQTAHAPFFLACPSAVWLVIATVWVAGWEPAVLRAAEPATRPNVLLVLADDLGIECVESYGGQSYKTPQIDALAAGGVRFTHCFSTPYCTPSRAQLLTGRYPLHNGMPRVIFLPGQHREFLDPNREVTFASLLQKSGYATAIAGKWQVAFLHERDTVGDLGFDEYQLWQIFVNGKKTSRYANPSFRQNGKLLQDELRGQYGPDVNVRFLIDFMARHRNQPFLAYYTALLPHWPWEPTPDSTDPLKPARDKGDPKYMPDMVAYLDKQVGQLVAALDQLGLRDNTLVLFVADNGTDQSLRSKWRGDGQTRVVLGGKGSMTDAGTRVPMVANWPGVIAPGRTVDDLIDLSDFFPTLLEVAGAKPGPNPINGRSFGPQLRGESGNPREWIHVQREKMRHVRDREYILNNNGALRPVVEIGQKRAAALKTPLSEEAQVARDKLALALKEAANLQSTAASQREE